MHGAGRIEQYLLQNTGDRWNKEARVQHGLTGAILERKGSNQYLIKQDLLKLLIYGGSIITLKIGKGSVR